jgi:tRNA A37 threonylcarbamoyltransferase TsaD
MRAVRQKRLSPRRARRRRRRQSRPAASAAPALGDDGELFAPSPRLATDNAAMIARAALFHYERGRRRAAGRDGARRPAVPRVSNAPAQVQRC